MFILVQSWTRNNYLQLVQLVLWVHGVRQVQQDQQCQVYHPYQLGHWDQQSPIKVDSKKMLPTLPQGPQQNYNLIKNNNNRFNTYSGTRRTGRTRWASVTTRSL